MLFNSVKVLIFFPLVTACFFLLPHRFRWAFLLLASCVFYMAFIPVYILFLLLLITIDYTTAIWIEKAEGAGRKWFLVVSILSTCLALFVFKYFDFFNNTAASWMALAGYHYKPQHLGWLLPIGLSFHTFQSLSYVIEVYNGRQKAERNVGIYALYVMFYPQLVAGPIERPGHLLKQFYQVQSFKYEGVSAGLKLMAWGMLKKVVIADRLALFVNSAYTSPASVEGITLLLATVFFAFQIYCDFSGYTDIAIGAAKVMGFDLVKNFNRPYISQSVAEFWKRWHISLSSWFRDYVYIPLGGNRVSVPVWTLNILITFLISGLWHGANWTFVIWGLLNGIYIVVGRATEKVRALLCARIGLTSRVGWHRAVKILTTFVLVNIGWVFFRAGTVQDAFYIIKKIIFEGGAWCARVVQNFRSPDVILGMGGKVLADFGLDAYQLLLAFLSIGVLLLVESALRERTFPELSGAWPVFARWSLYYAVVMIVICFGVFNRSSFMPRQQNLWVNVGVGKFPS